MPAGGWDAPAFDNAGGLPFDRLAPRFADAIASGGFDETLVFAGLPQAAQKRASSFTELPQDREDGIEACSDLDILALDADL